MVRYEKTDLTRHALKRMRQRGIPEALIRETMESGRKVVLYDRKAVEYTLKNVLGLRGVNLVVVVGIDGAIITSYVEKVNLKRR